MKEDKIRHNADSLFTLSLFLIFTLSMTFVMAIGAVVYQKVIDRTEINYQDRTGLAYIINKVRAYDIEGSVTVREIEGQSVLILEESFDKLQYQTWIYWYNGQIKELMTEKGYELPLESGLDILEARGVDFSQVDNNLLSVTVESLQGSEDILLALRSEGK